MLRYRMDLHTPEEMAVEDPFGGRGLFLSLQAGAEEILGAVQEVFGAIPAVAWPGRGAWIDLANSGKSAEWARARWEER